MRSSARVDFNRGSSRWTANKTESMLRLLVVGAVLTLGFHSTLVSRGLFADGSWFLLTELETSSFYLFDNPRLAAQIVTQLPLVIALKLGLTEVSALIFWHSFGLIMVPSIIWVATLLLTFRLPIFWLASTAYAVSFLTTSFFSVGEYNLCYALVAHALAILWIERQASSIGSIGRLMVLSVLSVVLHRSYESMIYFGPLLFIYGLVIFTEKNGVYTGVRRLLLAFSIFAFSVAAAIAYWSVLYPRMTSNLSQAADLAKQLSKPTATFIAIFAIVFVLANHPKSTRPLKVLLSLIWVSLSLLYVTQLWLWNSPKDNYDFRTLSGLLLFMVLVTVIFSKPSMPDSPKPLFSPIIGFSLVVALSIPQVVFNNMWAGWIQDFKVASLDARSWQDVGKSPLGADQYRFGTFVWAWNNPSTSILFNNNVQAGLLNPQPESGWQPFIPSDLKADPLARYDRN